MKGISEASGIDAGALMANWLGKTGFPLITVEETDKGIKVKQNRFLSTGDAKVRCGDERFTAGVPHGHKRMLSVFDCLTLRSPRRTQPSGRSLCSSSSSTTRRARRRSTRTSFSRTARRRSSFLRSTA